MSSSVPVWPSLTAAVDLVAAGAEVTILEARDRVGGRMHGIPDGPRVSSPTVVLPTWALRHTELLAQVQEYGLGLASTGDGRGQHVLGVGSAEDDCEPVPAAGRRRAR